MMATASSLEVWLRGGRGLDAEQGHDEASEHRNREFAHWADFSNFPAHHKGMVARKGAAILAVG
jgi:hypothetical protein